MTDEAARGRPNHREHLLALIECWEKQPALIIPCSKQRRAGEIASWIRRLMNSDREVHEARKTISRLKQSRGIDEHQPIESENAATRRR